MMLALLLTAWIGAPSPEQVQEAKTYFDAGTQAFKAGYYLGAADAFSRASELVSDPAITFSVAQCYRLQYFVDRKPEHLRKAVDGYRRYLTEVPKGGRREDAVEHLAALEPLLATAASNSVEEKARTQLMITSQTEAALASIDDASPAELPLIREVAPGKHKVRVSAEGHLPEEVAAVAVEGRLVVAEVTLKAQPAQLRITAPDDALVSINGRPVGTAPILAPIQLEAGRHLVAVTLRGHQPWVEELVLARGEARSLLIQLDTTTQRHLSYYFLGGSAALLATSGVLMLVALGSEGQARLIYSKIEVDQMNLTATELDDYIRARERRNELMTASGIGLATAAALGGVGLLLYALDNPRVQRAASSPTVLPYLGPDGAGVSLQFGF